jgi:hypothetical protein
VVELLPSKTKAQSSNPNTEKEKLWCVSVFTWQKILAITGLEYSGRTDVLHY